MNIFRNIHFISRTYRTKVLRTKLSIKVTGSMKCVYMHVAKGGFYKQE
jgi:hypothetical protein